MDLTLVAEEIGRALAPVPWIDHVVAARLLARLGVLESAEIVAGTQLVALDPQQVAPTGPRLIPAGSIADVDGSTCVRGCDVEEALSYRDLDRRDDVLAA